MREKGRTLIPWKGGALCVSIHLKTLLEVSEMEPEPAKLNGSCDCRKVHFEVSDAFTYAMNCHCSNCRRRTGSAFKPFGGIARSALQVVRGSEDVKIRGEVDGHDAFCTSCGSLLYSVVRDGAYVHVPLGTLHDAPSCRPTAHIYVGSKAPWFTITDDLPQFDELPN